MSIKQRAPRNRTLNISGEELPQLLSKTRVIEKKATLDDVLGVVIHQDAFEAIERLPEQFIDLLIVDPPYNLDKVYNGTKFSKMKEDSYEQWFDGWVSKIIRCLKPNASIYVCCDWQSSLVIPGVLRKYFKVRNRITWEREKGRGAKTNWKNCSEDIWFCTLAEEYTFNVESVRLKRKVIAPYRDAAGQPKDWESTDEGNFRLTHPSNLWTDISIPFWSMPENTDHPTQKPEKLIAKLILASSNEGDVVFDPFLGSGTTAVTAKKLGRKFGGIEREDLYCAMAVKRIESAELDATIQGYKDGYFWERNSLQQQRKSREEL